MKIKIKKYSSKEWENMAQVSHYVVFEETRLADFNRIDYALLLIDEAKDQPCGYGTVRELDKDSVYWQFGGVIPCYRNTMVPYQMFNEALAWTKARYKRIYTLVKNNNFPMLKFYMKIKARIVGCRMYHGEIYLEHLIEL